MVTKRKLLLADDSITIQKVVNLTFADEGIEVVAFGNGSLAIEQLEEVKPDLVLADVHMPGLNGYEVCEKVKQSLNFSKVPVMLLVGSFEPFDEKEADRVGADDYLTKPFQSIKQLINKVTALLNHSSENNIETAPLKPIVEEEQFRFDNYDADESQSENNSAENSFSEGNTFGDGLKSKFVDSGMDDNMIETNSFNWFTPKTPEVQNDFDVAEKIDENQDVSYQTTYENPPIEVNQTVPLSFSDVQEIAANSSFTSPQDEWSVAEKDVETLSETTQHDYLKADEAQHDNQNNVGTTTETNFDFEPSSIPKDDWRFDDANDNSWKISPLKTEVQQIKDFYLPEAEKSQFDEPKIVDFDATMEIKDEDKPLEYKFEEEPQGFNIVDSTATGDAAENEDWYKPQLQQNTFVAENTILELGDNKPFDFSFKDDDSILDLFQESQVIKTEVSDDEPEMEVSLDDGKFSANPNENEAQPFAAVETTFEPAMPLTDNEFALGNVGDTKEAGETPRNFQIQEGELPESDITSQDSGTQNTQVQGNQAATTSNFELLSPVSQRSEIEKTNERQISQTRDDSFANFYFTPEIIDAIAQRVVEKISDRVIEKIAWEIVPDRFDLIVKKQIEERNRES